MGHVVVFTERQLRAMADEYLSGVAIRAIARRHRSSFGTVRRRLLRMGVTLRTRGAPPGQWGGSASNAVPR